jgi:hypothetical protein
MFLRSYLVRVEGWHTRNTRLGMSGVDDEPFIRAFSLSADEIDDQGLESRRESLDGLLR